MDAVTHLSKYNVSISEARKFIIDNLGNLHTILNTAKQYGVTNEMLAEIYGGVNSHDVRNFFTSNGFDSVDLDTPFSSISSFVGKYYISWDNHSISSIDIGVTAGEWIDYELVNTQWVQVDHAEFDITAVIPSGIVVNDGKESKSITFSDDSLSGNIHQINMTWSVISEVDFTKSTEWEINYWSNGIQSIDQMKDWFIQRSEKGDITPKWYPYLTVGDDVEADGSDLSVKLVGEAGSLSGSLVKMIWDKSGTGKIPDYNQVVPGYWKVETTDGIQYLIVETTGIEKEIYKMDGNHQLVVTEVEPVGFTHSEQWYYGTDLVTFASLGLV